MRLTSLIRPNYNLVFFAVVAFNPRTGDPLYDKSWEYSFFLKKKNPAVRYLHHSRSLALFVINFVSQWVRRLLEPVAKLECMSAWEYSLWI